jgi:hypothetical protein
MSESNVFDEWQEEYESTILNEIESFVKRFVFLKDSSHYLLVAVWILMTHLYKEFRYVGYLYIHSSQPGCGKSRLMEVLHLLVKHSSGILVSPTEAVLFHTADDRTQLLDEFDSHQNRDALRGILNAGFQKNGRVPRMMPTPEKTYKPVEYPVYAPRALAGVGKILDRTTSDRTFEIIMEIQPRDQRRHKLNLDAQTEAAELRQRMSTWAESNKEGIQSIYVNHPFEYLGRFRDRTIDIAQPLAAIMEKAYDKHPRREDEIVRLIEAISRTREDQESLPNELEIFRHLDVLCGDQGEIMGNCSELIAMCPNLTDPPPPETLGHIFKNNGFEQKSHRKKGEDPKRRYEISREKIRKVLAPFEKVAQTAAQNAGTSANQSSVL